MKIEKGFFQRKLEFSPFIFISAICLWIFGSYVLNDFFHVLRKVCVYLTQCKAKPWSVTLDAQGSFVYGLFFASIAATAGYGIALRFLLHNSLYAGNKRIQSWTRRTLTTAGFNTWLFLFVFAQVVFLIWISIDIFFLQHDIDFISDLPVLLILLPLVLFYATWPLFSRLLKTKKPYFLGKSFLFLVLSFSLALLNSARWDGFKEKHLSKFGRHAHGLELPESSTQNSILRYSHKIDVYLVRDSSDSSAPSVFVESMDRALDRSELIQKTKDLMNARSHKIPSPWVANMFIDKRIPVEYVIQLLKDLRKCGIERVQFSTGLKNSNYPRGYLYHRHLGIGRLGAFPDTLGYESNGYMMKQIIIRPDKTLYNNRKIEMFALRDSIYDFIKTESPNYTLALKMKKNITYGSYLLHLDAILVAIDSLRNDQASKRYSIDYRSTEAREIIDTLMAQYPLHLIEQMEEN